MSLWRTPRCLRVLCVLACFAVCGFAWASAYRGQVTFNGLPVPGATVTATQGDKKFTAISDAQGNYAFPDLPDGAWKIDVEIRGFAALQQSVTVSPNEPSIRWELKMLPLDQVLAQTKVVKPVPAVEVASGAPAVAVAGAKKDAPKAANAPVEAPKPADDSSQQSNDGFLVNGSVNNAATSQFSLAQGFGNTRKGTKSLYTGGFSLIYDNSALDARTYSLSGQQAAKPAYNRITASLTFGGPLNIPKLMPKGPNFYVGYQWTRDSNSSIQTGIVPTAAQRSGVLGGGVVVPVSGPAAALLALYPLPNVTGLSAFNYQAPVLGHTHQDAAQMRLDKGIGRKDQVFGQYGLQSTRADNVNLFGFRDRTDTLAMNMNANWQHRFKTGLFMTAGYRFSRVRTLTTPYFANRANVSGLAGITGNDQTPDNWGPPTLVFSTGITGLNDGNSAFDRNRTEAVSYSVQWFHHKHNVTAGGDFRRQENNYLHQSNPRGTFTFTNSITGTGTDFSHFLAGTPDTAAVAFGNADKYFRQSVYDAYVTDDWRLRPELTLNVGARWEYGAPITELKGRLVNLDVAPGFTDVRPVLATNPIGPLTGQHYPTSLVRPDKTKFEPRLGVSWRPIPGSSLVVRAGYGIYADTSIYLRNASRMAVQPPFARNLNAPANSLHCPLTLTLATGLAQSQCDQDTFGVDPNFRVGSAQTWQVAVQRDLPAAMQLTATYLGVKGSNGVQQFLPNSYALGIADPCPSCPQNFYYRTTDGTSSRNAGSVQLRRRLRSGFTATATYTWSKSIDDDAALGGQGAQAGGVTTQSGGNSQPAQNWRDLHAERSLSTFDQRHLLNTTVQYTSGQGLGGGTLLGGWRGRLLKEWTAVATVVAGSGLPENPIYLATVPGTGETGILRPDRVAAPLYTGTAGRFLNAGAFAAPAAGKFGNAGRNSIEGPGQLTFNASVARTFLVEKKYFLDARVDATNVLNHPVYSGYYTGLAPAAAGSSLALTNPLFGAPTGTNAMRSLQVTARLRF